MRILMITSSYPKYPGETTAPFIEEIAAGIAARGHSVHVAAPWRPDIRRDPVERGVSLQFFRYAPHPALNIWGYAQSLLSDTHVKPQTLAAMPFALLGTLRTLFAVTGDPPEINGVRAPFDLIHAHWVLPNSVPAALVARQRGIPLVISLHGSDVYLAEQHWALAAAAHMAFRSAAAVTACSSDLRRRGALLGARPASCRVVPYGIHPGEFRPDPDAARVMRTELGLPSDAPIVFGIGRLVAKKGFGVLIDAWPDVLATHPDAHLVIAGYGDLHATLYDQAQRLGIAQRVHFPGQLERARAATYIAAADVFTLPIVPDKGVDGLPNVLLEAMGAGRPIVASRVAGVPDVIDDGVHGLITPARDPAALAAAIQRLLDDRALAARLGAAARQRIETELTWDHTAAQFEQVYESVL